MWTRIHDTGGWSSYGSVRIKEGKNIYYRDNDRAEGDQAHRVQKKQHYWHLKYCINNTVLYLKCQHIHFGFWKITIRQPLKRCKHLNENRLPHGGLETKEDAKPKTSQAIIRARSEKWLGAYLSILMAFRHLNACEQSPQNLPSL